MPSLTFEGETHDEIVRKVRRWLASVEGEEAALTPVEAVERASVKKDQVYQARLRMRLDTAQLPKPFQLNAVASRDWTLSSDWHRWSITP